MKYSPQDRFKIGKYASIHGSSRAVKAFKVNYPSLNESTVRGFLKKYVSELETARQKNRSPYKALNLNQRGRSLKLGPIDENVRKFLIALRNRGGVVNSMIAITTAKALIAENTDASFNYLTYVDISKTWAKSLFKRMGFVQCASTIGKVHIPESAIREAELSFQHKIVNFVEKYNIPSSLVLNSDQTVGRTTLAQRNTTTVTIAGSTDKRSITATFTVTLGGKMLPFQLIYGGKTMRWLPSVSFPESFSLSVNEKHFSNTDEVIKHLMEVVVPYVNQQRKELLLPDQPALLIWDVFRGQLTDPVTSTPKENNIFVLFVPNNMTDLFQPLDLTTNKWVKDFMKKKFCEWFTAKLREALKQGQNLEEVDIKFQLTTLKTITCDLVNRLL